MGLLGCRSPQSFMAFTVFEVAFIASPPRSTLAFFSSSFKSSTALDTTVEMTMARDSHIFPMALATASSTAASSSALLTEDDATTFAAEALVDRWEAVWKALQVLDHAGCASLQFAHFACPLSLFRK